MSADPVDTHDPRRRQLLKLAAAGAAGCVLGAPAASTAAPQPARRRCASPTPGTSGHTRAAGAHSSTITTGSTLTRQRLTWPEAGERVPPLTIYVPDEKLDWVEAVRKGAQDARAIGLEYDVRLVSTNRWLEMINTHRQDIEIHGAVLRPERVDPADWLVSRAYGLDFRNYGEEVCCSTMPPWSGRTATRTRARRLIDVRAAQRVLCDDYYMNQVGWGPTILEAYNSGAFSGVVPVKGFGIGSFSMFHSFLDMEPRTTRRRLVVGSTTLLTTTNVIGATNTMRNIGRMIYDRLAFLSPDLQPIPWAAESWRQVDERTWDVTLRAGMQFHDGHPVTIDDLKFTFDFL